jgi:hypothetical protein
LMRKTKWTAMTTPWAPLVQGSLFAIWEYETTDKG